MKKKYLYPSVDEITRIIKDKTLDMVSTEVRKEDEDSAIIILGMINLCNELIKEFNSDAEEDSDEQ